MPASGVWQSGGPWGAWGLLTVLRFHISTLLSPLGSQEPPTCGLLPLPPQPCAVASPRFGSGRWGEIWEQRDSARQAPPSDHPRPRATDEPVVTGCQDLLADDTAVRGPSVAPLGFLQLTWILERPRGQTRSARAVGFCREKPG